jgi:hypothetical protein
MGRISMIELLWVEDPKFYVAHHFSPLSVMYEQVRIYIYYYIEVSIVSSYA